MGSGNEVTALLSDAHNPGQFCQLVRKQMDIGLTFARTAELEYSDGNREFGTRAARSAIRIYTGVKNHLDNPYLGSQRGWVEEKLKQLETLVNELRQKHPVELEAQTRTAGGG